MKASVIIATCNRCDKLKMLLDRLRDECLVEFPDAEVLVVDNGSKDGTAALVKAYASLAAKNFKYIWQSTPGKCRALNTGVHKAQGDILVFTDDDCVPQRDWLKQILAEFVADPSLAVLGGRVELYDKNDLEQAVLLSRERVRVASARNICQRPSIIGANMAFKRSVFLDCLEFDPLLGPGAPCKAAEDLDVLYQALKQGLSIVYSPDVVVLHNHGRATSSQDLAVSYTYALGRGSLYGKYIFRADLRLAFVAVGELLSLGKTLAKGFVFRENLPYHKLTFPALFKGAFRYLRARLARRTEEPALCDCVSNRVSG